MLSLVSEKKPWKEYLPPCIYQIFYYEVRWQDHFLIAFQFIFYWHVILEHMQWKSEAHTCNMAINFIFVLIIMTCGGGATNILKECENIQIGSQVQFIVDVIFKNFSFNVNVKLRL